MTQDARWLRATLDPDPVPPPDLADRAEHTARGIVRRRAAAAALAVAALVAVPFAVQGTRGPDRTAGPNPTATVGAPCPDPSARVDRSTRVDVTWPYRGDPALRSAAAAAGDRLTAVRPLFGARLSADESVLVLLGRDAAGRRELRWRTGRGGGSGSTPPSFGPGPTLSHIVLTSPATAELAGWLVVVAPPGTTEIAYTSCPAGAPRRSAAPGDTAVIPLRPRELQGVIELRTPSGVVTVGSADGASGGGDAYPLDPPPVPAGYREVFGVTGDGRQATYSGPEVLRDARVVLRCAGPEGATATMAVGDPPAPVPCDGEYRVAADGVTLRAGDRLVDIARGGFLDVVLVVPDR